MEHLPLIMSSAQALIIG